MTIVSNALRNSAGHHAAHCMYEIAGVCRDSTTDKTAGCVLCHACHDVFDGRVPGLEKNSADWNFYALRALVRQMRWWQQWGFITIKGAK